MDRTTTPGMAPRVYGHAIRGPARPAWPGANVGPRWARVPISKHLKPRRQLRQPARGIPLLSRNRPIRERRILHLLATARRTVGVRLPDFCRMRLLEHRV